MRQVGILQTGLTLPYFCAFPKPELTLPSAYVIVIFAFRSLMIYREMVLYIVVVYIYDYFSLTFDCELLLFNANSSIFQLSHGENKFILNS